MRMFGLLGLVLALLIVGLLAKNQMAATRTVPTEGGSAQASEPTRAAEASARVQAQQVQQQYKQALDAALQTPRPMADE